MLLFYAKFIIYMLFFFWWQGVYLFMSSRDIFSINDVVCAANQLVSYFDVSLVHLSLGNICQVCIHDLNSTSNVILQCYISMQYPIANLSKENTCLLKKIDDMKIWYTFRTFNNWNHKSYVIMMQFLDHFTLLSL